MIEVRDLTRTFRSGGIRDVTFSCRPGTVTGFLGPNGAGKSTTLRILCGLDRADSGTATVDGVPFTRLPQPGRRVGTMLDPTAMHPGRSGRETLVLMAGVLGVGRARVGEVLELVDLDERAAAKRVGQYSLGMRQRLAIAGALLADPAGLVLDEPANGLDPQGIHWMRRLLRDHADRGGTVLLSSHLLHEVEAVADRLVIINSGRVVADAPVAELRRGGTTVARALEPRALAQAMEAAGIRCSMAKDGSVESAATTEDVGRVAASSGAVLTELRRTGDDLESAFLDLTSDHDREKEMA